MNDQQQHEMILDKTHPTGADEWYCPTCGRRLLMDYEPKFRKIVLEAGDDSAIHSGGKGGLQMGSMQIKPVDESPSNDPSLGPWSSWFDDVDFDSLWDRKD